MPRHSAFLPEVRERAIRIMQEPAGAHGSEWAAVRSIAEKLGRHPETLRNWMRREGRAVARCTVARLYTALGLRGAVRRRRVTTTIPEPLAHWPQDLATRCTDRLLEAAIESSVGSRGDAYDNALAETINGLYKSDVIHHLGPWKGLEDVEYATLEWVAWYSSQRLMEPLGYVPPAEFEAAFHRARSTHRPRSSTNRVSGKPGAILSVLDDHPRRSSRPLINARRPAFAQSAAPAPSASCSQQSRRAE